jgi:hypothetical protein
MTEHSIEEPEDDVAEQEQEVFPDDETDEPLGEPPLEADEADAAEQARIVHVDDDDYL